ncbi:unnamed protein product [Rotaria socialis]|uniref:BSD domain-containing protein n=1 Tax=Rotaria socialis TaxID=392032 RepID=A0A818UBZ7_9BILA|nr:unnamed protein product [Rotaria socialis]CAF4738761.1 unnamed protein product [Rotaria socialis]
MSSWFTSVIQSVRDKSVDALDFVRRDLAEFTTTVKSDTEIYLNQVANQDMGELGFNRLVSKLSGPAKADTDHGKHIHATPSFDRIHNELARLQNDESTYLSDPIPDEAYETWRQTTNFNVEARKGDISRLLIDVPHVRSYYARFVPAQTTHLDFWSRYYYRLHLIEEEETRRTQLLRRAHEICSENNDNTGKNNENDWDEPDDEWSKEPSSATQESTEKIIPMEKQESRDETVPTEKQESRDEIVPTEKQESRDEIVPTEKQESRDETVPTEKQEPRDEIVPTEKQESRDEIVPMEKQESIQESPAVEYQQELAIVKEDLEITPNERKESDTGDSWECEFDEADVTSPVVAIASHAEPLTESKETTTSESLSSSTVTTTTTTPLLSSPNNKTPNEFDDDWESWA